MTRLVLSFGLVALLAACGADGAPITPEPKDETPPTGISISGSASVGIAKR
ncbi:argininosuccinate lyase [Salipiger bermudensis]|uniref:argininosuccinate lyase n=1 Tax=Salipiger bermudensis TaxID=344736 RepID=UPI001C99C637|nr:argininosuccinate lyase [Salipiger bermudensis]MBY6003837.1 argininosuccinate lyase [Salipiger bermudensis]